MSIGSAKKADIRDISTQVQSGDNGLVTNSVIHGKSSAGGGTFVDVKVNPAGKLLTFDEDNQPDEVNDYAPNQTTVTGTKKALQVDPSGQLITRSTVLTDEDSYRDDFNDVLLTDWTQTTLGSSLISVSSSKVTLQVTNSASDTARIEQEADYLPANITFKADISNRYSNQELFFGWVDNPSAIVKGARFIFTGTDETIVICQTQSETDASNIEQSIITMPLGGLTSNENTYTVSLEAGQCRYLINGFEVAVHKDHLPNPYDVNYTIIQIDNTGASTGNNVNIDYVFFQNINQLEITNNFKPLPTEIFGENPQGLKQRIAVDNYGAIPVNFPNITLDAGGRLRSSQITTLADLKILGTDRGVLFDNQGTGTGTFGSNMYNMSVTSGQFFVRQQKYFNAYFSGKSQLIETTFDNFQPQANTTKRVGYFSSNAVSPFASTYDGFWLESGQGTTNGTVDLVVSNNGVETVRVAFEDWDNYENLSTYDWSKFTVVAYDFLWLGGATLRVFIKTDTGFLLGHTYVHAGNATSTMILSPNQPVRYEIRSTTGTGSFRFICAQVGTEGSLGEAGLVGATQTGSTAITLASTASVYPIKAIRKQSALRDVASAVVDINVFTSSNSDQGIWTLQLNPTLSAALTYANITNTSLQQANGNGTITVTSSGRVLAGGYQSQNQVLPSQLLKDNYLSFLGSSLNNTMDELVLCFQPIAGTPVQAYGTITYKEY